MKLFLVLVVALFVSGSVIEGASGRGKSSKKGGKGSAKTGTASGDGAIGTSKARLPSGEGGNYDYLKVTKKKEVLLEEAIMQRKRHDNSLDCVENLSGSDVGIVTMSSFKADELGFKDGDIVRLQGKRRKETCAILALDDDLDPSTIRTSKSVRQSIKLLLDEQIDVLPALKKDKFESMDMEELLSGIEDKEEKKRSKKNKNKEFNVAPPVASKIEVLPYEESILKIEDADLFEDHIKPYFTSIGGGGKGGEEEGEDGYKQRPVMVGDIFTTQAGGEFQVISVEVTKESNVDTDGGMGEGEVALVGPETEIVWDGQPISRAEDSRLQEIGYDDIGGCRSQLAAIRELVELPLRHPEVFSSIGIPPPRGVLLHGPSGTGKTSLAKAVAAETGAFFFVLNGPEIMSKQSGESESRLRKAFEEAEKNSPAIIFIDEIDAIAPKRDKAGGETEKRVVSQLLTLFDGIKTSANVVVIAATNRPNDLDSALRRFGRFDRELNIAQPSEEGRLEILRIKTRNMQLHDKCDLKRVAKNTHGYVGADLAQVCMEAAFRAIREVLPFIDVDADPKSIDPALYSAILITDDHFDAAIDATNPSSLRENLAEVPDTKWADIGGLEDVKQELRELVQLPVEYGHLYEKFGTASSKGVLFYGPPGCGKTLLAKAIANEAGANFISIKGPELLDAHIGESEANVRALFDKARAASPCILFFDEMDSIAKARGGGGGGGGSGLGDNVINQILTEIDGIESTKSVFIIGATNRPDILDTSVTRPGHLDQLVYIPLPDYESRLSIFKANLRKCPVDPQVDLVKLARSTEGFSGADITEICQRAAKNAIREDIQIDVVRATLELEELNKRAAAEGKPLQNRLLTNKLNEGDEGYEEYLQGEAVDSTPINSMFTRNGGVKWIRKDHFEDAMRRARRSVTPEQIEQYKVFMDKEKNDAGEAVGFSFEKASKEYDERRAAEAAGEGDEDDEDSLYS